jgi:hypothetical protein
MARYVREFLVGLLRKKNNIDEYSIAQDDLCYRIFITAEQRQMHARKSPAAFHSAMRMPILESLQILTVECGEGCQPCEHERVCRLAFVAGLPLLLLCLQRLHTVPCNVHV